jgi:hypothetical protein
MKKIFLIAAVIGVFAIIAILIRKPAGEIATLAHTEQSTMPLSGGTTSEVSIATAAKPTADRPAPAAKLPAKLAYAEAVKRYGTQRIQFDTRCQATPASATFKSGLEIMLDNRADTERSIVFSGKTYNIAAYDYAAVKLTETGIIYIDCDASQNVARLLVQ